VLREFQLPYSFACIYVENLVIDGAKMFPLVISSDSTESGIASLKRKLSSVGHDADGLECQGRETRGVYNL